MIVCLIATKVYVIKGFRIISMNALFKLRKIYLAFPRGFCAGVERAVKIVNLVLEKYGSPIYVRHQIVHNRHVVSNFKKKPHPLPPLQTGHRGG